MPEAGQLEIDLRRSVGVAQPAIIAPTTTTKIDTSGSTYWKNGCKRRQPLNSSNADFGASSGESLTRITM